MGYKLFNWLRATSKIDYTILIPVYDETTALAFSKFYFDSIGQRPLYVLDSKKAFRQKEVEEIVQQAVPIYSNSGQCIEAGYEQLVTQAPTDWIFRVDCDEIPTLEALAFCRDSIRRVRSGIGLFDRRQLRWHEGTLEEINWPDYKDAQ